MQAILALSLLLVSLSAATSEEPSPLIVHEWGTFTCLQDESGNAIGGLNTDDEPLPHFVHTPCRLLVSPTQLPSSFFGMPHSFVGKGIPALHPDITMRLETPIIYFYPPKGSPTPLSVDVHARFKGGWLTEFYPRAEFKASGIVQRRSNGQTTITKLGGIGPHTIGSLTWKGLKVGVESPGPTTQAEVWLAPRRVRAAGVSTPEGENEKYLFYRGVGHLNALLRVHRSTDGAWLEVRRQPVLAIDDPIPATIDQAWLAHIRSDGSCAFIAIPALKLVGLNNQVLARVPAHFPQNQFSTANLATLRAAMHQALVAQGLFADEAEAMLATWQQAYFHSPGLRLFFTVPPQWTNHYLPLDFSVAVELTRVMIGRIEIVTPQQRHLLAQIAARPAAPFPTTAVRNLFAADSGTRWQESELYRQVRLGKRSLADLGVALPASFVDYLKLGRLRNALLLNELSMRPTEPLERFVKEHQLTPYQVPLVESDANHTFEQPTDHQQDGLSSTSP